MIFIPRLLFYIYFFFFLDFFALNNITFVYSMCEFVSLNKFYCFYYIYRENKNKNRQLYKDAEQK